MTDADGFRGHGYRPQGLPQDVIDPSPEEDDLAKHTRVRTSYDNTYATEMDAGEDAETASQASRSSSSSYTYVNSNRVSSPPPPPSAYGFMFPARRVPESLSDQSYGPRSSMDYTPRTSEYAPSYTTEWTPPESADDQARPPSTYVPPTEIEDLTPRSPLVPQALWRFYGARSSLSKPRHSHRNCFRIVLVLAVLIPLLLWKIGGGSVIKDTFAEFKDTLAEFNQKLPQGCNLAPDDTFAMHGTHSLPAEDIFTFTEALSAQLIMLGGTVHVRSAMDPEATNVTISYTLASSSESALLLSFSDDMAELVSHVDVSSVSEAHILSVQRHTRQRICATAHIVITLPRSVKELALATTSLTLSLDDGIALETLLATTSHGGIHLSRDAQITNCTTAHSSFGSISGTYNLGRHLRLETSAGSINAAIRPLAVPFSPATLTAKSDSGSINLSVTGRTVPVRNYTMAISTAAGSIAGEILLGSRADLSALAGAIRMELIPVGDMDADVNTETQFGSTAVTFKHDLHGKSVWGRHKTRTGAVAVKYPSDWEGRVLAMSPLGIVDVRGEGTVIERRERDVVEGYRGDPDAGGIEAISSVGSVEVLVG